VDTTTEADVDGVFDTLAGRTSGVAILVRSAGASICSRAFALTRAGWDVVIAVIHSAGFLCSRAVARKMLLRNRGVMVNVASIHGFCGRRALPQRGHPAPS
jgi:NAD(P)-dependent dehydrogenase (short-subunit alcohol dehydrogenase family)